MKACVFSFNPPTPDGSLANARTAQFVADTLKLPLICGPEIANETDLDILFLVAGVFMYCRVLPQVAEAIRTAKRVVWIQNDYTIRPPLADGNAESPFRYAFRHRRLVGLPDTDYWSTMAENAKITPYSAYLNWNCMAYEGISDEEFRLNRAAMHPAMFYYGADRAGRQVYFDRYFKGQAAPLVISSFSKSMVRYAADADVISAFPRRAFFESLSTYSAGLYLEDKKSHAEFTSPATRFYEMLSVGMAMFFQPEAVPMLERAGFAVRPYAVRPDGLSEALQRAPQVAIEQRAAWAGTPFIEQLQSAMHKELKRLEASL